MKTNLEKMTQTERVAHLNGLYNAIIEDESKIEDIFKFSIQKNEVKRKSETKLEIEKPKKTAKKDTKIFVEDIKIETNGGYAVLFNDGVKASTSDPNVVEVAKTAMSKKIPSISHIIVS